MNLVSPQRHTRTLVAACSLAALSLVSPTAGAQGPAASAAAPTAPASAAAPLPSSPAKKDLSRRLVAAQQQSLENMSRNLVEEPARQLMAAADSILQTRVAPEKREAAVKQIQDEVRRYMDSALPIVRDRATKLAQTTLAPALEEKFTEDELRQIVTFLESPANKKLQQTMPEVSNSLAKRLVMDSRPQIDPKVKLLEANVAKALGVPAQAGNAASPPATKAAPAPTPAPKPDNGSGLKPDGGSGLKLGQPPQSSASAP